MSITLRELLAAHPYIDESALRQYNFYQIISSINKAIKHSIRCNDARLDTNYTSRNRPVIHLSNEEGLIEVRGGNSFFYKYQHEELLEFSHYSGNDDFSGAVVVYPSGRGAPTHPKRSYSMLPERRVPFMTILNEAMGRLGRDYPKREYEIL